MHDFSWDFGERFRRIRKLGGMSQEEFGVALGVSRQTINAYENDRQRPTMDMLERVCKGQDVSPHWLLTGLGEPTTARPYGSPMAGGFHYAISEGELVPEQTAIMNFVAEDPERAYKLTQILLDGGLSSI